MSMTNRRHPNLIRPHRSSHQPHLLIQTSDALRRFFLRRFLFGFQRQAVALHSAIAKPGVFLIKKTFAVRETGDVQTEMAQAR